MLTSLADGFTEEAVEGLRHLLALVREHEEGVHGSDEARGDLTLSWEPPPNGTAGPNSWWLSIVMPGHYAYEQSGRPNLPALILDAIDYYSQPTCIWDPKMSATGCRHLHPYTGYNVQLVSKGE